MRKALHQPVGNPIQIDRLPRRRPRIVFSPRPADVDGNEMQSLQHVLRWLAWLSFTSMVGAVVWYPTALGSSGPEDFWLFLVLAFVVARVLRAVGIHEMPYGVISLVCLGALACWVLTPLSWLTHLLIYALTFTALIWRLASTGSSSISHGRLDRTEQTKCAGAGRDISPSLPVSRC